MKNKMVITIAGSLVISIVIGVLLQGNAQLANMFSPLGTIYLNLIKMIMVPLVFTSLVLGVANIGDLHKLGKLGILTIIIFLSTTSIAVITGIVLSKVFQPGLGITLASETYEVKEFPSVIDTFVGIVPSNPLGALVEGNMLQIIFFAIVLGIGIVNVGKKGEYLKNVMDSLYEVISEITKGVMYLTPLGILGLMIPVVASNGLSVLLPLLKVILVFYLGVAIHIGLVYCFLLKKFTRYSIKEFFKKMFPALVVGFTTCSSSATLPVSLKQIQNELKVSKDVSSFVLSLGATINMDGNALYQGIVALFVAQAYGVDLTFTNMFMIVLTGTLASIGAAGVPGAGMIVLSTVLMSVGLPVDGIVIVAGIDRILDMGRTMINICGDAVTATIVDNYINN
ncbi:MAG: dicarboxylate/amino acid:cation symporter [Agathobacter sp.]|nr:dicarboxylate/amino acid:cation symporter [Agathobacter sp.]